jgi:hypothetical protein
VSNRAWVSRGVERSIVLSAIRFDPATDGLEIVRSIVFQRLRVDASWNHLPTGPEGFSSHVHWAGHPYQTQDRFLFLVHEVMWELIIAGVLSPGLNANNPNLPWFHVTDYGRRVLKEERFVPHDPTGYLDELQRSVPAIDPTVLAYLTEALQCFHRGLNIGATMMLGVAAERVFMLVCDSVQAALSPPERRRFEAILNRNAMKPKLDWVLAKTTVIRRTHRDLPDSLNIAFAAVYDFIRQQRNDLGHPRDQPPSVTREEAFVNLRVFPTYYVVADGYRQFLAAHPGEF